MAERYENTFVREVKEKNMTKPEDILNWYRNLYHTEDNHTEHGIMAYAINDYFADVVPISEVDEYKHCWQKIHDSYNEDCLEHYNKGRQDAAREIFEEIEKLSYRFMNDKHYIFGDMVWDIAELKKKYTEDKE
jgi:hypothetical protein